MSNAFNQCGIPGCGTLVPAELQTEGLCLPHFLLSAEKTCTEMRRETAAGNASVARRAEIESYVATSAVKLACIGTGSLRSSDEIKKRILTTFHMLMILRENLDRAVNPFLPRQRKSGTELAMVAAAGH